MKCVLMIVLLLMPLAGMSQDTNSQSDADLRDLTAKKTALINDLNDFLEMAKSLPPADARFPRQGVEVNLASSISAFAQEGIVYIDATIGLLTLYEKMQCEPDRLVAKGILRDQLRRYSHILNDTADSVTSFVGLTTLPRTAQEGRQLRDELRAAKDKMDAIAISLN